MTSMKNTPKPGSMKAVGQGCTCPIIDNGHGRGIYGDGKKYGWVMNETCPLHGALIDAEIKRLQNEEREATL